MRILAAGTRTARRELPILMEYEWGHQYIVTLLSRNQRTRLAYFVFQTK